MINIKVYVIIGCFVLYGLPFSSSFFLFSDVMRRERSLARDPACIGDGTSKIYNEASIIRLAS